MIWQGDGGLAIGCLLPDKNAAKDKRSQRQSLESTIKKSTLLGGLFYAGIAGRRGPGQDPAVSGSSW